MAGWGSISGRAAPAPTPRRSPPPAPCSGTARWALSSWSRSRPARAPSPRPSRPRRERRWLAAATRLQPCSSSGSVTKWTGSRPEEEHRWSCWRERSCREWRRCQMPERTPYLAANWKMHKTVAEAAEFVDALLPRIAATQSDVVICAPFTALSAVVERRYGTAVKVAAQNMHEEDSGAFTGEISAPMLAELGVEAVVLGHSERRQLFGETDEALARKVPAALAAGLEPILCVGESEEARDGGQTEAVLERQLQADLAAVEGGKLGEVVIAYEPIWAIGTGRTATPEQAQETLAFIRDSLRERGAEADAVRILYGGSVKPGNAAELLGQPDIDGALGGGASLDPGDFAAIVAAA